MPTTSGTSAITIAEAEQFAGTVAAETQRRFSGTCVNSDLLKTTLSAESAVKSGCYINKEGRVDPNTGTSAMGIGQMFPNAFVEAYTNCFPATAKTMTVDQLKARRAEILANPKTAILLMGTYLALIEKTINKYPEMANIQDPSYRRAILGAAYHMGAGAVRPILAEASEGGFSITRFTELYENWSRAHEGSASDRVRKLAGVGGSTNDSVGKGSKYGNGGKRYDLGPLASDATDFIVMGNVVGSAALPAPATVIQEGLDVPDPLKGLTGNPKLRILPSPACFELRLNQQNGDSLASNGSPLQVKLNVSLQSLRITSQHIVDRSPTATGLLLTFWGMQPDMIVGRGTTGVFLNKLGLTSLMSTMGSAEANGFSGTLKDAFQGSPDTLAKLLNTDQEFRVASQDAFAELLALFKNNGLTRFLPERMLPADDIKNQRFWSPAAGATGFQMIARSGEVHTRGYVAFKYKGSTYLGYFKSFAFVASADKPYQWNFDFQFKVLQTYTPIFVRR